MSFLLSHFSPQHLGAIGVAFDSVSPELRVIEDLGIVMGALGSLIGALGAIGGNEEAMEIVRTVGSQRFSKLKYSWRRSIHIPSTKQNYHVFFCGRDEVKELLGFAARRVSTFKEFSYTFHREIF